jgi:hypothetical protein
MKRMVTVSPELRLALKKRIDAIGRQAIAAVTDFRYTTLGQKLTGFQPLSEDEYIKLSLACDQIENKTVKTFQKIGGKE